MGGATLPPQECSKCMMWVKQADIAGVWGCCPQPDPKGEAPVYFLKNIQ